MSSPKSIHTEHGNKLTAGVSREMAPTLRSSRGTPVAVNKKKNNSGVDSSFFLPPPSPASCLTTTLLFGSTISSDCTAFCLTTVSFAFDEQGMANWIGLGKASVWYTLTSRCPSCIYSSFVIDGWQTRWQILHPLSSSFAVHFSYLTEAFDDIDILLRAPKPCY